MTSDKAQIMLMMLYDITYNIHNHHANDAGPLDVVSMHPTENYHYDTALYKTICRYALTEVKETYGLSLVEYLSMPKHIVDMITHAKPEIEKLRQSALKKAAEDAKLASGKDGKNVGALGSSR